VGELSDLDTAASLASEVLRQPLDTNHLPAVRTLTELQLASKEDATYWRNHAIPDPTVSVGYTRDFYVWAGDQPHTVGVNVTLPIPLFDTGGNQARGADTEAQALGDEISAQKLAAESGEQGLVAKQTGLERKLDMIVHQLLPRSESVVVASETAYRQGQSSMTDLLLVRRDHLSLKLDELDTRYALFAVRNQLRLILGLTSSK
jgi:outer membrane protein, heavy metal efflux system